MNFLYVLLATVVLVLAIHKPLRKYPLYFYALAIALDVLYVVSVFVPFPGVARTLMFILMQKCTLSLALFMVVMYIGVFSKESKISLMLRPVRAELSILACYLSVGHMAVYLASYLPRLLSGSSFELNFIVFFIASLILLVLLLVLGITSFQVVKSHLKAATWKKIQKWAYVFFALVYVHLIAILLPSALSSGMVALTSIIIYTVLFGAYALLRIIRWQLDKRTAREL